MRRVEFLWKRFIFKPKQEEYKKEACGACLFLPFCLRHFKLNTFSFALWVHLNSVIWKDKVFLCHFFPPFFFLELELILFTLFAERYPKFKQGRIKHMPVSRFCILILYAAMWVGFLLPHFRSWASLRLPVNKVRRCAARWCSRKTLQVPSEGFSNAFD